MSQVEYGPLAKHYEQINEACVPYDAQAALVWQVLERHGSGSGKLRALDIAAGPGLLAKRLAASGLDVVGFDLSGELVRQAHGKSVGHFAQADMRHLPFAQSFDVACCLLHTVNYMTDDSDLAGVFDEIARVLKPGGLLLMDFIAYTPRSDWRSEWTESISLEGLTVQTIHRQTPDWRRMVATDLHTYTVTEGDQTYEVSGVDELRITSADELSHFAKESGLKHLATAGKYALGSALGYDGGVIVVQRPNR